MKRRKNYSLEIILAFIFVLVDISIVFAMQEKIIYVKNRNSMMNSRQNDIISSDNQEPVSSESTTSDNERHSNDNTNNKPELKTAKNTSQKRKSKPKNDEHLKKEFGKNSFEYKLCKTLIDYRETYFK